MEPSYFGPLEKRLFGVYHQPRGHPPRDCGIVFCCPLAREYTTSHRVYRQMATALARHGFPVLRFDFYGCGDSEGEDHEGSVSQWLTDIGVAVGEIGIRCEPSKLCLVGLRFGATLAMIYGSQNGGMEGMVLWDPIAKGSTYVGELGSAHPELLRSQAFAHNDDVTAEQNDVALGLPPARSLFRDLREIDLLKTTRAPARSILLIDSEPDSGPNRLREHLGGLSSQVDYQPLAGMDVPTAESNKLLFGNEVVRAVVSWISAKCP